MIIDICEAEAGDIDGILTLWQEYMGLLHSTSGDYWKLRDPVETFRDYLVKSFEMPEVRLLAARDRRAGIAGFTLCHMEQLPEWFGARPIGFIRYIAVAPEYRKKGLGRRMMADTVRWFAGEGIDRIELFVLNGLEAAGFWEKMGFRSFMDRRFLEI